MENVGKLTLRVSVGLLMMMHGIAKLGGVDGISTKLVSVGLPGALANFVYVGEVLAPLMLIAGMLTRPAAMLIVFNMLVAIFLFHGSQFFQLGQSGGHALELQLLYLIAALCIAMMGGGRYSWDARQTLARFGWIAKA
ncbi:DoxX family protein [Eoetvoesiella caeni]